MSSVLRNGLVLIVMAVQVSPTFAGSRDYKPSHGGYSGLVQSFRTKLTDIPRDSMHRVLKFLDSSSHAQLALANKQIAGDVQAHREVSARPRAIEENARVVAEQASLQGARIKPLNRFDAAVRASVTPEFAKLGNMYEIASEDGDFIVSSPAKQLMRFKEAKSFCESIGGYLPYSNLIMEISRSMAGFGASFFRGEREFWTSTVFRHHYYSEQIYAKYLGKYGSIGEHHIESGLSDWDFRPLSVFCVRGSPATVHAITPIDHDERVPAGISALGDMALVRSPGKLYPVNDLILSSPAPQQLSYFQAEKFCKSIGGDLPNKTEASALAVARRWQHHRDSFPISDKFWISGDGELLGSSSLFADGFMAPGSIQSRWEPASTRCVFRLN